MPIKITNVNFIILNIEVFVLNAQETGKLIRERRRILNIAQKTAAELSNVSVHTLSDIESGKGNPSVKVLSAVLDALGLELRIQVREL